MGVRFQTLNGLLDFATALTFKLTADDNPEYWEALNEQDSR